jgi:teichuronic acid biosynthesis glycosyltransferase TuaC
MPHTIRVAVATHFVPSSSQPFRGRPIYEITKALANITDVQVFCVEPCYPRPAVLQPRTFVHRDADSFYSLPGVEVQYLKYSALPFVTRLLNGHNCGRALLPNLREFQPDLVIGYNVYPEGFGVLAAVRELGIPAVIGAIGSDLLRDRSYFSNQQIARTIRNASFVITVSENLRERAIQLGIPPEKCRAIHNGCDFAIFKPSCRKSVRKELNLAPGAEVVVFTGRLVPSKGLRELFEAAAILRASRPQLQVVCIGEGPMEEELRQRAAQLDLAGCVSVAGVASPPEIARWLAASNVLCLPSHSEGCPNVVIEALSCGRPVVASNVGGIPELLNSQCGILVPPKDVRQLAKGLSQALDYPWSQEDIATRSRRSWDDVARETYDVCCSVVREPELVGA